MKKSTLRKAQELADATDIDSLNRDELKRLMVVEAGQICRAMDAGKIKIEAEGTQLSLTMLIAAVATYAMDGNFGVKNKHGSTNSRA